MNLKNNNFHNKLKNISETQETNKILDGEDYIHPQFLSQLSRRQIITSIGGIAGLAYLFSQKTQATEITKFNNHELNSTCSVIPTETEGPYPASKLLKESWIYRSDITENLAGLPLQVQLNIIDTTNGCQPLTNAAVYLWHADKDGNYSGYGNFTQSTFMRGVQVTDENGQVTFETIYPGWYPGRITHIHFEVFRDNNLAQKPLKISQLAFPQNITQAVYSTDLYKEKGQNTSVTSFTKDNVFRDGVQQQLATISGSIETKLLAQLNVGV